VGVILSNKDKTASENAVITIDGSASDYKSAVVYAITQDSSEIRIIDVQNNISGNKVEVELPPLSVAHVVISDELTDKTEYEEPDITVKETVYNVNDLATSADGSYLIPLGDKKNLKEIKFALNSYSTEGSAYYSGGGGLCFSKLTPISGGEEFWGFKTVNFSNGQTEIVVPFDEYYTDSNQDEVKSVVGDTEAQWQPGWWKFSEKQGDTGSDIVVNYTTVTLVYEYDGETGLVGDVNGDGKIDVSDVVALSKWLANIEANIDPKLADVIADDCVNIFDLAALKRKVMKG